MPAAFDRPGSGQGSPIELIRGAILGDGDGLGSALTAALDERGPALPLGDVEQLELLRDERPDRGATGAVQEARRRGRPAGSANKRTAKLRDWLLRSYAHPLEVLAQTYSRPVELLAAELACTKLEAMALQQRAAAELAPYIEGKMPVSVDVLHRSDLTILMPGLNAPIGAGMAELEALALDPDSLELEVLPFVQNQELSGGER